MPQMDNIEVNDAREVDDVNDPSLDMFNEILHQMSPPNQSATQHTTLSQKENVVRNETSEANGEHVEMQNLSVPNYFGKLQHMLKSGLLELERAKLETDHYIQISVQNKDSEIRFLSSELEKRTAEMHRMKLELQQISLEKESLQRHQGELQDLLKENEVLRSTTEMLNSETEDLHARLAEYQQSFEELQRQNQLLSQQLEQQQNTPSPSTASMQQKDGEIKILRAKLAQQQEEIATLQRQLQGVKKVDFETKKTAEKEVEKVKTQLSFKEAEIHTLQREYNQLLLQLEKTNRDFDQFKQRVASEKLSELQRISVSSTRLEEDSDFVPTNDEEEEREEKGELHLTKKRKKEEKASPKKRLRSFTGS